MMMHIAEGNDISGFSMDVMENNTGGKCNNQQWNFSPAQS